MFVNTSKHLDRIYGYALNKSGSVFCILCMDENKRERETKYINVPKDQKWAGMEMTTDGELMVVSNACKNSEGEETLKMMAIDLNNLKIRIKAERSFSSRNFNTVQFMKKIKGYDFFVVACKGSIGIVGFTGSDFVLLNLLENIYEKWIFEIAISKDFMIPLSVYDQDNIKVIQFNCDSYNSMLKKENWRESNTKRERLTRKMGPFGSQKVKKISAPFIRIGLCNQIAGKKKVNMSYDGRTLFFGGKGGLAVLKRKDLNSSFKIIHEERSNIYH